MSTTNRDFDEQDLTALDTLDNKHQDFPWHEIDAAFADSPDAAQDYARLGEALRSIFRWIASQSMSSKDPARCAGRNCLALLWVLDPDYVGGTSMSKLAAAVGIHKVLLARSTAEASRLSGVRNRAQCSHDWRRMRGRNPDEDTPEVQHHDGHNTDTDDD